MDKKRNFILRVIAIVLFFMALYLTVLSPFSESAIELINGGYGTFDMKEYSADGFIHVMNATSDISLYWKYYICDFVFIFAFLNFMIQMVNGFKGNLINKVKIISYVLAAIRGILDAIENVILVNQIYSFPEINSDLINACNIITRIKFYFMRGWIASFIILIIMQIVSNRRVTEVLD